jgi:hypothetical protein
MTFDQIRDLANRLRCVPLEAVLQSMGAQRDPRDKAKWRIAEASLSVTGMKFMDWHRGVGGGGAIDLVIHLRGVGFKQAVHWLHERFEDAGPTDPPPVPGTRPLRLPSRDDKKLPRVRRYLNHQRALPPSALEPLIDAGLLYADPRTNAVFLLLAPDGRPVGAELRGTSPAPWRGLAPGSRKDLGCFAVLAPVAGPVILCESAIDALSCHLLRPDCLCLSTSGARPAPAWLPALLQQGRQVYCGFDSDPTGEAMATAMIARYPAVRRLCPPLHDWNDVLKARR